MNPVYFPFTYISEATIEALALCFRQTTTVYQAISQNIPESMKKWAEKGILDIRTPVITDEQKIISIIRDYKKWANIHQGSEKSFLKFQKENIPFFEDTSEIKIRSEIKKYKDTKTAEKEKPDPLLNARIFLQIAQEFDIQNQSVNQELGEFKGLEQKLMKHLHDDDPEFLLPNTEFQVIQEDMGNYMTSERIEAWLHLMQHDDSELSGIFITDSPAVLEYIIDKVPDMKMIHQWDAIPVSKKRAVSDVWQNDFMKYFKNLAESSQPDPSADDIILIPDSEESAGTVSLKICLVPGKTPYQLFNQCISRPEFPKSIGMNIKNTLIGYMEIYLCNKNECL